MIEYLEHLTFVQVLLFAGGIGGGVTALVGLYSWAHRWWDSTESYCLEYSPFEAIMSDPNAQVMSIEARTQLCNPHDVTLRMKAEQLITTFDGKSHDSADGNNIIIDIAPNSHSVCVHTKPITVVRRGKNILIGRIDWLLRYGPIRDDGSCDLKYEFPLSGDLSVHFFKHGPESRWSQDHDIPAPLVDFEQIDEKRGGEFFLRGKSGEIAHGGPHPDGAVV